MNDTYMKDQAIDAAQA